MSIVRKLFNLPSPSCFDFLRNGTPRGLTIRFFEAYFGRSYYSESAGGGKFYFLTTIDKLLFF